MKTVAIVGRPNVGKSSLYNALVEGSKNIVSKDPSTTVDTTVGKFKGRCDLKLLDSKGFLDIKMESLVLLKKRAQAYLWVVEAGTTPTSVELALGRELQKLRKPVWILANKIDRSDDIEEFLEWGFPILKVCATQGLGLDAVGALFPQETSEEINPVRLALIGRPNVGKSSLINRLAERPVSVVSPIAHTTRDPVSDLVEYQGTYVELVDTAGVRRPRSKKSDLERLSIRSTQKEIARCDVACLIIKSDEAITDQDSRLLDLLIEEGKPTIILFNFWDQVFGAWRREFFEQKEVVRILKTFPVLEISAKTGLGVHEILAEVLHLNEKQKARVPTAKLNRLVQKIVSQNPPPFRGKGHFNILYASQVSVQPSTFLFFMNRKESLPDSYRAYLTRELRKNLNLSGQAIRVFFRQA